MEELKNYKLIVELAQDAIFIKDLESRYILVNQKTLEAFGNLPREEVLGKNDYGLLPPDEAKVNIEDDQKVFKTGKPMVITKKMTAGGKEVYFQAVKAPLKDEKGKVVGLIGIARDVTEGKWLEETLNKINELLLSFSPNQDDNLKRLVETTGLVLGGTCALYNKEKGAFLYTMAGWNLPEDFNLKQKKNGHLCHDVIRRGEEGPFIINNLDKTGYAKTDPNVIKYGLKTYIGCAVKVGGRAVGSLCVGYQEDKALNVNVIKVLSILARALGVEEESKCAVKALQVSEQKFRALFDSANDGILLADAQSKKFYTGNKKICQMLGYSLEEIKNLGVRDIHPREAVPYVIGQFEKQFRKEISVAHDLPVKRKDGSIFYADINASTIEIDGNTYLMGIFRDISERKQAEKMLEESEAKLREQKTALEQKNIALSEIIKQIEIEKDKMKDDIAANVSKLIFPLLAKLKTRQVSRKYVDLLQCHLEELISSFGRKITEKSLKLTPREIEICSMVKGGLTSKEISGLLNISYQTIEKHRKNIRHKLGLSKKNINLTTFLHTL